MSKDVPLQTVGVQFADDAPQDVMSLVPARSQFVECALARWSHTLSRNAHANAEAQYEPDHSTTEVMAKGGNRPNTSGHRRQITKNCLLRQHQMFDDIQRRPCREQIAYSGIDHERGMACREELRVIP